MRRLLRIIWNAATALSLLVCVTLVIACATASGGRRRSLDLPRGLQVLADGPQVTVTRWQSESAQWWTARLPNRPVNVTASTAVLQGNGLAATSLSVVWRDEARYGFHRRAGAVSRVPLTQAKGVMSTPLVPYESLAMPWYYPLPLLLVLPVIWLIHYRRRARRVAVGLCPACGYDLRATPASGGALLERCPECGKLADNVLASAAGDRDRMNARNP